MTLVGGAGVCVCVDCSHDSRGFVALCAGPRQTDRATLGKELDDTRTSTTALLEAGRLREKKLRARLAEMEAQVRPRCVLSLHRLHATLTHRLALLCPTRIATCPSVWRSWRWRCQT